MSETAKNWTNKVLTSAVRVGPKRGRATWGVRPEDELRQPQDGSVDLDVRSRVATVSSQINRNGLVEPEDARITGSTRSLMRRLMGLNVVNPKSVAAEKPVNLRGLMIRKEARVA